MGDHFVFLVDRLLTESTLEAAIRNQSKHVITSKTDEATANCGFHKDSEVPLSPRKMVECRICQDEDFDSNMETPCSCCGSLKFAHRRCIQRWCNEKGDTICEICLKEFKPNYTAPPPIFRLSGIPMNLRGNWRIARRDYNNQRFISMVPTDNILDSDYDEYDTATSRSIICCRSVALILMFLLILRHTLPVVINRGGDHSISLFMLLFLRIAGIIFPICIILRAITSFLHRRHRQANMSIPSSEDEGSPTTVPQQAHIIQIR